MTTSTPRRPSLDPKHLQDLRASGLSDETIERAGLYTLRDPKKIAAALHWRYPAKKLGPCLAFPFPAPDGSPTEYVRLKPDNPLTGEDGKPRKYESPIGKNKNRAYFPPRTLKLLGDPAEPLLITEGEKKALKADQEGLPCIGLVGVEGWSKRVNGVRHLIDDLQAVCWGAREVYIVYDSDLAHKEEVKAAERSLAKVLTAAGANVKCVRLPEGPANGDGKPQKVGLDDYLVAHTKAEFGHLLAIASKPEEAGGKAKAERGPSQATKLARLILGRADLFHGPDQSAYATVPVRAKGPDGRDWHETHPLRSRGFTRYLARLGHEELKAAPSGENIHAAVNALEGVALFDRPQRPVGVRLAGDPESGRVFLDLADPLWRAVEVGPDGWRVVRSPAVKFRRPRGVAAIPDPQPGGDVRLLRQYVNVEGEADFILLVSWMAQALRPAGPYPVLCLHGEQGCSKSTTARVIRAIIDPSTAPLRSEPRDVRDLQIAAENAWVIAYDNLSHLPAWLSDALCRLATGGGFSTRELYTDREETIFDSQRPCILTSIEDLATRGDLLERAIILRLPQIKEADRRTERDFNRDFERDLPRILGAFLSAVSAGLRDVEGVKLAKLPRMADFAQWAAAVAPALGWSAQDFLDHYGRNREDANELALEASPLVGPLRAFIAGVEGGNWQGTASELLRELSAKAEEAVVKSREWPKKPHVLSGRLRRLAPNLAQVGIRVEFDRGDGKDRKRFVRIAQTRCDEGGADEASGASKASETVATDSGEATCEADGIF